MKYSFSERIIKCAFYFSVWIIESFTSNSELKLKLEKLDNLDEGTVGKEIANCLKANNLNFVPYYESHDLKHVLLDFKMTPLDEIRMQAFMLGNGNWSVPSVAIFMFGALLLPSKWPLFVQDFRKGRAAIKIKDWAIEDYANRQLDELKELLSHRVQTTTPLRPKYSLQQISQVGSFVVIAAGIFGMLFCFPFLWSSNVADLVGAGLPFIAGAILIIGGLINLSLLSRLQLNN